LVQAGPNLRFETHWPESSRRGLAEEKGTASQGTPAPNTSESDSRSRVHTEHLGTVANSKAGGFDGFREV
jgi:hypothetical protein